MGQPSPNGVSARRSMACSPREKAERRQDGEHEQGDADRERPCWRASKQWCLRVPRRVRRRHPRLVRQHRARWAEVRGVGPQHAVWVQPDVSGVRPKGAANVDVARQEVEALVFEREEVLTSNPGVAACLFECLPAKESGGSEGLADAGVGGGLGPSRGAGSGRSLHGAIVPRARAVIEDLWGLGGSSPVRSSSALFLHGRGRSDGRVRDLLLTHDRQAERERGPFARTGHEP